MMLKIKLMYRHSRERGGKQRQRQRKRGVSEQEREREIEIERLRPTFTGLCCFWLRLWRWDRFPGGCWRRGTLGCRRWSSRRGCLGISIGGTRCWGGTSRGYCIRWLILSGLGYSIKIRDGWELKREGVEREREREREREEREKGERERKGRERERMYKFK